MAEKFSLKDHLFNPVTVNQLAAEFAVGIPGFDPDAFTSKALAGFPERELLQRLDWLAECLEPQLATDFNEMADQIEASLPKQLDPTLADDDFGHFIHAVPGVLAVRHGLEKHCARALDLLYEATKRFSMEFYIRPFLNVWPAETLARLALWAKDENYHVRRLVSEGTRPKLPWAKAVALTNDQTNPLLDALHADPTRYVTRSVANHLNDISKTDPEAVLHRLEAWTYAAKQTPKELDWMRRHALRTLIKQGHAGAMEALGYRNDAEVDARLRLSEKFVKIGGVLEFEADLTTKSEEPLMIDYVLWLTKADGSQTPKVFKLKAAKTSAGKILTLKKTHKFKGDASTFTLRSGPCRLELQVNGRILAEAAFELLGSE